MKAVFLNVWHGERHDELRDYLAAMRPETDIFCLQEADGNRVEGLRRELFVEDYTEIAHNKPVDGNGNYAVATYVRNGISILSTEVWLAETAGTGFVQHLELQIGDKILQLCNVYGVPRPGNKRDTPERMQQSREIIDRLAEKPGAKLIGGDFNLMPDIKSVQLFEDAGYRNLIRDHDITTTRNRLAWERWPGNPQLFADYAFASSEVSVIDFQVPPNEVSDHLPLVVEFEI